jgi:hypothetical protein
MKRWVDMMMHHGGGPIVFYDEKFFRWVKNKLIMVEEYAYKRMDFQGDVDVFLTVGYQWNDSGKKKPFFFVLKFQKFQCFCRIETDFVFIMQILGQENHIELHRYRGEVRRVQ